MSMPLRGALVALMVTWVGCAASGGATMVEVAIESAGERPGRPPLIRLLVDVTASNPTSSSRWLLIARKLPAHAGGGGGGVDKNEQHTAGSVVYGVFLGSGGFYGFLLGPGAVLAIKNLEIGWWNDEQAASPPALEVRTGTAVTIAGADLATWFDRSPALSGKVEVDAGAAQHTYSKKSDSGAELEVSVTGLETRAIAITVAR